MKKILCIFLSIVLLVLCLTSFTNAESVVEDVPLIPIPGVESSDDYNEDVAYPPVGPSDIAIQRWTVPGAIYNSRGVAINYVYDELKIDQPFTVTEYLPVQNKFYVDDFYGSLHWPDYKPNVVITNQDQLDCFFAWYCNPKRLPYAVEELLERYNGYAENAYRKLSTVDYAKSTVVILTMDYRIDGLVLHDNALFAMTDKNTRSAWESSYTYFYVISNDVLPENRDDLVIMRASYQVDSENRIFVSPYNLYFATDIFCFVDVNEINEISPIEPIDLYQIDKAFMKEWIAMTGAEEDYSKLFAPYRVICENRSIDGGLYGLETEIPKEALDNDIEYEVFASSGDFQYRNSGYLASSHYVATTVEEALSLTSYVSGWESFDNLIMQQKIREIDFSEKALVICSTEVVSGHDNFLKGVSVYENYVVLETETAPSEWYPNRAGGAVYYLLVNKADLPNEGKGCEPATVLTTDPEADLGDAWIAGIRGYEVYFEEYEPRTTGVGTTYRLYNECISEMKK